MLNPDFALGFKENGLNPYQDKACEQKNRRRIQCNTPRTLLRAKRGHGKELETFYHPALRDPALRENPNANSGLRGYYFITDSTLSLKGNTSDVKQAVAAGVTVVQYRDKCSSSKQMYEEALELRRICKAIDFLINDRIDIALAVGADGVHLGCGDLPYKSARKILGKNKIIGLTAHNLKEAKTAQSLGVDYIGVSPIFATKTKKDAGAPAGIGLIEQIRRQVSIPIIAIGGINLSNAEEVIAAGADGLCAISAVVTKPDVKKEVVRFQALFNIGANIGNIGARHRVLGR